MTEDQTKSEKECLEDRLHFLHCLLNYERVFEPMFYRGEKICINQERASIYDLLNFYNNELEAEKVRTYQVPESIEQKIKLVKNKIFKLYNI